MSEQNINTVKEAYAAFNRGDITAVVDMLDDNVDWHTPDVDGSPFYGKKRGKAGAIEFFQGLGSGETPTAFEQHEFIASGDKVVILGRWAATVNATGRHWDTDLVHVFTIRDGKITAFREFFDNALAGRAFQHTPAA